MNALMTYINNLATYTLTFLPQALEGIQITVSLFILALLFSIPLGVFIAAIRLYTPVFFRKIASAYILVMRGTPLILQIAFIFYGLPLIGLTFDRFPAAVLAFTLNYAAYFAEIFRGGIESIDQGQYEACEVLGLSPKHTFFRIIFPQALKRVLPPVGNEVVTLVKDTALVSIIALDDLMKVGKNAVNRDSTLIPFVIIAIIYFVLTTILSKALSKTEKKYSYYR